MVGPPIRITTAIRIADQDLPTIGGILDSVSGGLGEMLSIIASERQRPLDECFDVGAE